jgi:CTD kinase subunit alpha
MVPKLICGPLGKSLVAFDLFSNGLSDMKYWTSRCIFLELFARRPVFQGQDEIHQLDVIFKTTGTPSVATWPTLRNLPWYELVKPKLVVESKLREVYSKYVYFSFLI